MVQDFETSAFRDHLKLEFPHDVPHPKLEKITDDLVYIDSTIAGWASQGFTQDVDNRDFLAALDMIDKLNRDIAYADGHVPADEAATLYRYTASLLSITLEARRNLDLAATISVSVQ